MVRIVLCWHQVCIRLLDKAVRKQRFSNQINLNIKQQIKLSPMSYTYSRESYSHSLQKPVAGDDIKKGLEKIKQAQIQVLRELRKEDGDHSRNHSLTYSKQTTYDSKPLFKFEAENTLMKHKGEKIEKSAVETAYSANKPKQDYSFLNDQMRKYKEAVQIAETKMKEYEKGEERALAKAQQALSNAITSEKKYIGLKGEYDRLIKQRERLVTDMKRMQKKQISQFFSSSDNEHIPTKIIQQLNSINECVSDLMREINSHRCFKKQDSSNSKNTSLAGTSNSFTISTIETQSKLDKSINNMIAYFQNLHNFAPINNFVSGVHGGYDNYLSGSFREDIQKLQQEMSGGSNLQKERVNMLQSRNATLEKKNIKLEGEVREYQEEIKLLKSKIKALVKDLQETKRTKTILSQEYEKYKAKTKEKEVQKEKQFQSYRKKQKLVESAPANYQNINGLSSSKNPQKNIEREVFEDRIIDLEKENASQAQKLKKNQQATRDMQKLIQKLRTQLEMANVAKQELQTQYSYEINRLNTKANTLSTSHFRNQIQWEQMVQTIKKLEEEKAQLLERQSQIAKKLEAQTSKYEAQIEELESSLKALREQIQQLHRQNTDIIIQQRSDVERLRNEDEKEQLHGRIEEVWDKKEGQHFYRNGNIGQAKNKSVQSPRVQVMPNNFMQTSLLPLKSQRVEHYEQSPRRSFDPFDRLLLHNHSPLRLSPNMMQVKEHVTQLPPPPQLQVFNPYPSISMGMQVQIPQNNPGVLQQHIQYQYQPQYVVPMQGYRVGYPQNIILR